MAGHQLPAINDFDVAVRGTPGGLQEENQTRGWRALPLNQKKDEPEGQRTQNVSYLIGKGR